MQANPDKKIILVVDDDIKITSLLYRFLSAQEFSVIIADSLTEMQAVLAKTAPDLIVLDKMLPDGDGFAACQKLREQGLSLPIILLTAVGEEEQRIIGLNQGADDYLTKPFNSHELLARIQAILRRVTQSKKKLLTKNKLHFQGWTLDKLHRRLYSPEGFDVSMTDGEYRLLETLAEHAQEILNRDELLKITENREAGPLDRTIDVRISRLRQKLGDDPKDPKLIKTVRGGGYTLTAQVSYEDE